MLEDIFPLLPGSAWTCSTFSSISEMATDFFLSGFNFQYISRAAFLTPLSKRVSVHNFFTSSKFSKVMPEDMMERGMCKM